MRPGSILIHEMSDKVWMSGTPTLQPPGVKGYRCRPQLSGRRGAVGRCGSGRLPRSSTFKPNQLFSYNILFFCTRNTEPLCRTEAVEDQRNVEKTAKRSIFDLWLGPCCFRLERFSAFGSHPEWRGSAGASSYIVQTIASANKPKLPPR